MSLKSFFNTIFQKKIKNGEIINTLRNKRVHELTFYDKAILIENSSFFVSFNALLKHKHHRFFPLLSIENLFFLS